MFRFIPGIAACRFAVSTTAAPLIALLLTALSLLAPAASADPFLPVPPASFLDYHVDTVRQLTEQVQLDPAVRARLARHFHRTGPQMTSYIQNELVLTRLPAAGRYRMACIRPSGREYWITERLAAGTPVFVLRGTGQPVLRLACGNPLVKALPLARKVAPMRPAELIKASARSLPPVPAPVSLATVTFPPDDTLLGPGDAALGPLVRVAGITQSVGGGRDSLLPLLGVLGLVPFAGGHGSSPTVTETPVPRAPLPAPEPSPALFFGLAGVGLAVLRRQRSA